MQPERELRGQRLSDPYGTQDHKIKKGFFQRERERKRGVLSMDEYFFIYLII